LSAVDRWARQNKPQQADPTQATRLPRLPHLLNEQVLAV
jgi:hypothetical protein